MKKSKNIISNIGYIYNVIKIKGNYASIIINNREKKKWIQSVLQYVWNEYFFMDWNNSKSYLSTLYLRTSARINRFLPIHYVLNPQIKIYTENSTNEIANIVRSMYREKRIVSKPCCTIREKHCILHSTVYPFFTERKKWKNIVFSFK